jgi:prepilin-type N-terminal cleavage/methylation domain-containing protein
MRLKSNRLQGPTTSASAGFKPKYTKAGALRGFTLVEVVIALGIVTLLFSGILTAYIQSGRQAEWAGYSLAAQAIGVQQIEQARSAVWDFNMNQLTNLHLQSWTYNATTQVGTGSTCQSRGRTSSSRPIL